MIGNSTNLNIGRQLLFATIAGSSFIAQTNYDCSINFIPTVMAHYTQVANPYPWEKDLEMNYVSNPESDQYETILSFSNKVVSESKDIDIEIQAAVNKIFWDLI